MITDADVMDGPRDVRPGREGEIPAIFEYNHHCAVQPDELSVWRRLILIYHN